MDDPNAEAELSLGRIRRVLGKGVWWPSLAATWKPFFIMDKCPLGSEESCKIREHKRAVGVATSLRHSFLSQAFFQRGSLG